MPIPSRDVIKKDLMILLKARGALSSQQVYELLADKWNLTSSDKDRQRGSRSRFQHEIRWARQELVIEGVFQSGKAIGRGVWQLRGAEFVANVPARPEETAEKAGPMWGRKQYQVLAQRALPLLVRFAGMQSSLTYGELGRELGNVRPRNLNYVLGSIGVSRQLLANHWGEAIPPIESLVVNAATSLPGSGVDHFLPSARQQRAELVRDVHQEIFQYARWSDVVQAIEAAVANWSLGIRIFDVDAVERSLSEIATHITRDDVIDAARSITLHSAGSRFGESVGWDVVVSNALMAPKRVLGVAARRAAGRELVPSDFIGGEGSRCLAFLNHLDFKLYKRMIVEHSEGLLRRTRRRRFFSVET